jgi:hypothetical protein
MEIVHEVVVAFLVEFLPSAIVVVFTTELSFGHSREAFFILGHNVSGFP